jgi:hypothetical protein
MKARRIVVVILVALVATHTAGAFTVLGIDARLGQGWIGNGYREDSSGNAIQGSDVSPLKLLGGVALPLAMRPGLHLTPALDVYLQEYLATPDGKVVPTQIETGTAAGDLATTLSLILSAPVTREWQLRERLRVGAGGGLSLLLRLPVGPIEGSDTGPLWSYFYSGMRFLYPEAQGTISYELSERVEVGGILRVLFPVHSIWSEYDVPVWDEMMIAVLATFRFRRGNPTETPDT